MEEKDQIKKRLGFSPDLADALCLTFALPEMPANLLMQNQQANKIRTEYDPFSSENL